MNIKRFTTKDAKGTKTDKSRKGAGGYLALVYSVLEAFVCEHPQPPTPPPQERRSYDKAKYEEVQKKEALDETDKGIMNGRGPAVA